MLRTTCTITLALAVLASTAEGQSDQRRRIGLGVRLNPVAIADFDLDASVLPIGFGNFTVPVWVAERVRLEPELGILRIHSEASGTSFSGSSTGTALRFGTAVQYFFGEDGAFRPYAGAQFGLIRQTSKQEFTGSPDMEVKRTDNYFGVALGGEYWFTSRFSLGAEVQINRVGMGDEDVTPPPTSSTSFDSSFISNNGIIAVRFYL